MSFKEEYKEQLERQKFEQLKTVEELEKIIDLINHSCVLDLETITKTNAFLRGYQTGLKEQIEWLNCVIS